MTQSCINPGWSGWNSFSASPGSTIGSSTSLSPTRSNSHFLSRSLSLPRSLFSFLPISHSFTHTYALLRYGYLYLQIVPLVNGLTILPGIGGVVLGRWVLCCVVLCWVELWLVLTTLLPPKQIGSITYISIFGYGDFAELSLYWTASNPRRSSLTLFGYCFDPVDYLSPFYCIHMLPNLGHEGTFADFDKRDVYLF